MLLRDYAAPLNAKLLAKSSKHLFSDSDVKNLQEKLKEMRKPPAGLPSRKGSTTPAVVQRSSLNFTQLKLSTVQNPTQTARPKFRNKTPPP